MIYYSHVNEDNQIEWQVMNESAVHQLFAIAGSGERVITLLDHPALEIVHIIDINPFALYLTELKLTALKNLSVAEYLAFTGFMEEKENDRWYHFMRIRAQLSQPCQDFWTSQRLLIQNGICHCGHFEKFLHRIRPLIKAMLGKKLYRELSNGREGNNPIFRLRWALLKFIFSIKISYRFFGMRDPAFVSKGAYVKLIPAALQKTLDDKLAKSSCLFQLVFKGHLRDMAEIELPPSFQKTKLRKIKTRLNQNDLKLDYHCTDVLDFLNTMIFSIEKHDSAHYRIS
jgi:S-adenosylmethionine:diacylglycerol 3-amino-3-carboxypropyl transferase